MERLGRFLGAFFGAFLCVVLLMGIYSIAEDITLTTYYPAPYGAYDELTVTGNVGIGTTSPSSLAKLSVPYSDGVETVPAYLGYNPTGETIAVCGNVTASMWHGASKGALGYIKDGTFVAGVYASGSGNATYAAIFESGKVGIGTTGPNYPLDVAGDINTTGDVRKNGTAYTNPDYVFEPGYNLMNITKLKDYVFENRHLPNLPSTDEIKKDGVKLFEQNRLLLEKLEEAYLYIFKLEERISKLETIVNRKR